MVRSGRILRVQMLQLHAGAVPPAASYFGFA
jgi:hypothetical protein